MILKCTINKPPMKKCTIRSIDRPRRRGGDRSFITRFQEVSHRSGISQCNDSDTRLSFSCSKVTDNGASNLTPTYHKTYLLVLFAVSITITIPIESVSDNRASRIAYHKGRQHHRLRMFDLSTSIYLRNEFASKIILQS